MAKPNATLTDKPASKEASKHKKPPLAVAIMLGFLALLAAYIFATGGNAKSVTIAPGTNQPTITKTETAHAGAMGIFGGAQSLGYGMNKTRRLGRWLQRNPATQQRRPYLHPQRSRR